jgi:prostaglandin-endoperoxide synthase 2
MTNPLLARHVYNEDTFTPEGLAVIEETGSLAQIVARNASRPEAVRCSFRTP